MKILHTAINTILFCSLVCVMVLSIVVTSRQSTSGNSITTVCSPQAQEWIIENFDNAETLEELLRNVNEFIGTRTYVVRKPTDIFQHFDMDDFIANPNGLCFDWSCATSCIVKTVSARHPEWGNVTSVVVDAVSLDGSSYHSFNFITVDDKNGRHTYHLDTTDDNTRKKNGKKVIGITNINNCDLETFSEQIYGYKIFAYH